MRQWLVFILLFSSFAVAQEQKRNLKYHHFASVSYRKDLQKFVCDFEKQRIKNRNSAELILGSYLEYRQCVVSVRGKYGWLINERLADEIHDERFIGPIFSKKFTLGSGYTADILLTGGYLFHLFKRKNFAFSVAGSGGYQYSHIMNFPEEQKSYSLFSQGVRGFFAGNISNPNQQDWFGPLVEARFEFLFWKDLSWHLFAQYHWVTLRSLFKENTELFIFNSDSTPSSIETAEISSIYKTGAANGVVGGVHIRYNGPTGWNFGAHFEESYVWSHHASYLAKRETDRFIPTQMPTDTSKFFEKADVKWISYEFSLFLGYEF